MIGMIKSSSVHRFPGIYLTAKETPGKPQLGDRLKLCDHASPELGPLPPNEVDSIEQHVKERESRKGGRKGMEWLL